MAQKALKKMAKTRQKNSVWFLKPSIGIKGGGQEEAAFPSIAILRHASKKKEF